MADIFKKDESVLTENEQGVLERTLEKLEQYYPEHKTYAMDALCSTQRENCNKLSKKLGYENVEAFLIAYGFEPIKGQAVIELRKNVGITPGNEPELIKTRVDNSIKSLNEFYPDHVIKGALQSQHKNLAQTLTALWQWMGYTSLEEMLSAYGFTYIAIAGRKPSVDPDAIIAELKKRYPEGTTMTAGAIKDANPDLKIKSVMNKAKELFGMTFGDYLVEQGVIIAPKKKTAEEIAAEKKVSYAESLKEFDTMIQKSLLGWKPLPMNADMLFEEFKLSKVISKIRYNNVIKELDIDEEKHLRDLGVIADNNTDNELRELIQHIDFASLLPHIPKLKTEATSKVKQVPSEQAEVESLSASDNAQTHTMIGKNDQGRGSKMHLLIDGKLVFKDRAKVPGQNWSIGVPEGFVFSTDPNVNGKSTSNPSGIYDLILIRHNSRNKANFISPYRNSISFVTLDYTTIPNVLSLLQASKDYEWIADGEDLSILLVPLMSHLGINSFDVYVNSKMSIRRCQLIINGPYEKTETIEFARQLLKSIEIEEERNELNDESEQLLTKIESSNIEYDDKCETVAVDETWLIDVPFGYKYCTDKEIIGGHRNIIIMEDVEGNDFRDPFCASVSFTSMYTDSENIPAPEMAKMKAVFMGGDKKTVIKDEKDLYVSYYFDSSNIIDGDKLDVFKIDIGCGNGMSNIQVFFNGSIDTQKNQEKLVASVAKSIRLSKPGEESKRQESTKQEKAEAKHSLVPKPRVASRSKRNISMWGFTVSEVPSKRKKLIDNNMGYPIRFLPHSAVQNNWKRDMSQFQYYFSLHYPEYIDNVNSILEHAEKYSTIFSADGTSADIKAGKLRNSAPIHALRSFIWTAVETQKGKGENSFPLDVPEDMWIDLAIFIGMHQYANYEPVNKKTKRFGAALLRKEEVRSIYTDACGFDNFQVSLWRYQDSDIGKTMSIASVSSLFQLVDVLIRTMPIMDFYYNNLGSEGNQDDDTVEAMKTILMGWSTFAFACRQPFFIIPGEYCTEDTDMSSALSWAIPKEVTETRDGLFTLFGTEIIKAKKCGREVIIPDGVTGIIINEDTLSGLESAFENINKMVYPKSYTGAIIIPPNVREVEVFGDPEIIICKRLSDYIPRIEKISFLGKPKSVGKYAFYSLDFLKEIILPEGVEKIYVGAFEGWHSQGKIFLPESLNSVDDYVFSSIGIDKDVNIYVYKDCPAKNTIEKQVNDHINRLEELKTLYPSYNLKLIEQESPWSIRTESFVSELCHLRDKRENPDVSTEIVKEIFVRTIGTSEDFSKCKRYIVSRASEKRWPQLAELVKNSEDDQQLYGLLPGEIAEDINRQISNRIRQEKQRKAAEINALSKSNSIDNINKAIEMLKNFEYDEMDTDLMIEQSLKKIENIKAAKYSEAETLVSKETISSISAALELMKSIDPYKDTSDKINAYKVLLDKETEYATAVSSMQNADPQSMKYIKSKFEGLGDYKDSESKAVECSYSIDTLVKENNEKAKALLESESTDSFDKSLDIYKHLAAFDEDNGRIELYLKKIASINEIIELKGSLIKLEEEHAMLRGFFKKKKRLEVEERMKQVKGKIDGIKSTL